MIVFKNYFKIVKQHIGIIIMFSVIAIVIAVANTSYNVEDSYINVESKVGVINYDDSKLTKNFSEYIEKRTKKVEVNDDAKEIQDTLYNNKADIILIIPNNFTNDLLNGKEPKIEIKKSTQNYSQTVELLVNKYFKIANIYSKVGMSEDELIKNITKDLEKEFEVKISSEKNTSDLEKVAVFYSFENYAFLSVFIYIVGTIMCIFNKETISKRNSVSKLKPKEFSAQLFLGHSCLTLMLFGIFVLISIILYKDAMFNMNGLLLVINSLIFAITVTSLAYLIGTLVKNQNVISGVQNIISLGLSFTSGCFVPSELLDEGIVNFSKLFPSYWFINGNYEIVKLTNFDFESIKFILRNYAIVAGYCALYLVLSRVIIAKKSKK